MGDYLAVECTSVVHSFLQCIVGLNECSREHPLWFRTPLKIAVLSNSALFEGIGGDFGYSHCVNERVHSWSHSRVMNESLNHWLTRFVQDSFSNETLLSTALCLEVWNGAKQTILYLKLNTLTCLLSYCI